MHCCVDADIIPTPISGFKLSSNNEYQISVKPYIGTNQWQLKYFIFRESSLHFQIIQIFKG